MSTGSYLKLTFEELTKRIKSSVAMLEECVVCAQQCRVNRLAGEMGICRGGRRAAVSSYGPHFGEEAPLVGARGSGTIFFTYCNLSCEFCQNCDISQEGQGEELSPDDLADIMLAMQNRGCHNVNLVTPSHFVPQILEALKIAIGKGLNIPLVYNTGGYDSLNTLDLLEGIIDIYMPDIKFGDDDNGRKYSGATGYFSVARQAVKKMHQQVGDLVLDDRGVATRGLLVRHLVLPGELAGTSEVMEFLVSEISENTFVNIMDQYYPAFKAFEYPELGRRITRKEYSKAIEIASRAGLKNIYND